MIEPRRIEGYNERGMSTGITRSVVAFYSIEWQANTQRWAAYNDLRTDDSEPEFWTRSLHTAEWICSVLVQEMVRVSKGGGQG